MIMIDLGTGNNNKINWAFNNKQELIDIIEVVYRRVHLWRRAQSVPFSSDALLPRARTEEGARGAVWLFPRRTTPPSTDTESGHMNSAGFTGVRSRA